MYMLKSPTWQIPLVRLIVRDRDPIDGNISSTYGSEVLDLVRRWVNDSISSSVATTYDTANLTLEIGNIPFFNGIKIAVLSNHVIVGNFTLKVHEGRVQKDISLKAVSSGTIRETALASYISAVASVYHMEAVAAYNNVGLTTKERAALVRAKTDRDRVGQTKMVFAHVCQYPWVMTSAGLTIRANDRYIPFINLVIKGDANSSGLASVVQSDFVNVLAYYRRLYPDVPQQALLDALDDAGMTDWFSQSFTTFTLRNNLSQIVQMPPLLLAMKNFPATEAIDLMGAYLSKILTRQVKSDAHPLLAKEYVTALERLGFSTAKSYVIRGRDLFHELVFRSYGAVEDLDLIQVIDGSDRWADFCLRENVTISAHPAYWVQRDLDGDVLSGVDDSGNSVSVTVPPDLLAFVSTLVKDPDLFVGLMLGWEHFVASVYSASFTDFTQTSSSYRIKTFRPLMQSMGINGGMMSGDVIGVLTNV